MCYFVVAALPSQADLEPISEVFEKHGRKLASVDLEIYGPSIPDNRGLYFTCKCMCDCDTPIGSRANGRAQRGPSDRELSKLKKKGWSQAKIDRWIESKKSSLIEKERKRLSDEKSTASGIDQWIDLIRDAVGLRCLNKLGLILIWSPRRRNHLSKKITVSLSELSSDLLREVEENVLYDFVSEH